MSNWSRHINMKAKVKSLNIRLGIFRSSSPTKELLFAEMLLRYPDGIFNTDAVVAFHLSSASNYASRLAKKHDVRVVKTRQYNPYLNTHATSYRLKDREAARILVRHVRNLREQLELPPIDTDEYEKLIYRHLPSNGNFAF
ncbi:hypothetical protein A1OO_03335 [Enterovibrio norvegicus FF-33]|uniref:hypothetical protein n=1 Tax=Enterovibrio norvegicus TaxID=188144 RepID=UPI00036322F8|nr:hypothetical protein [Enterovibrio norvegicus]OEE69828.1 hypothetical protein A1OO_03335 [Enterovibrio norvegicus FF-33]